jgi:hypothetical protein
MGLIISGPAFVFLHVRLKSLRRLTHYGSGPDYPIPQSMHGVDGFRYVASETTAFCAFLGQEMTISRKLVEMIRQRPTRLANWVWNYTYRGSSTAVISCLPMGLRAAKK